MQTGEKPQLVGSVTGLYFRTGSAIGRGKFALQKQVIVAIWG